jgi:aspartyl-tRNA(Asn)/glutamyl-tRNA(Gln) amidotransferase subunit B
LRTKEDADDYRYFPEPDLVPVVPDDEWLAEVRADIPRLPAARRERLAASAARTAVDATVATIVERGLDDLAVAAIEAGGDPARILVHVEQDLAVDGANTLRPERLAQLTRLEVDGALTPTQAKAVLADVLAAGGDADPAAIAATKGFEAMDTSALEAAVDAAIAADPTAWAKYLAGDDKVAGAFVGSVMKATKGKADGKAVTALLRSRRDAGR